MGHPVYSKYCIGHLICSLFFINKIVQLPDKYLSHTSFSLKELVVEGDLVRCLDAESVKVKAEAVVVRVWAAESGQVQAEAIVE